MRQDFTSCEYWVTDNRRISVLFCVFLNQGVWGWGRVHPRPSDFCVLCLCPSSTDFAPLQESGHQRGIVPSPERGRLEWTPLLAQGKLFEACRPQGT